MFMKFTINLTRAENTPTKPFICFERTRYGLDIVDMVRSKEKKFIPLSAFKPYVESFRFIYDFEIELDDKFECVIRDSGLFRETDKIDIVVYPNETEGLLNKFVEIDYEVYQEYGEDDEIVDKVRVFRKFNVVKFINWWSEKGYPTVIKEGMV